jgi:hypothetical protein
MNHMQVNIHRAYLVIEDRQEKLSKALARQLPILDRTQRWDAAMAGEPQPEPICKVKGEVLKQPFNWMYLVEDEEAGLGWVAAMQPDERFAKTILSKGGWVDEPSQVPTVIL